MTPSEDSAKTEDEKKEEQEVKQEEKKEEKKGNTASTTNTSSNKITHLVLLNLQTAVAITLARLSHRITVVQTQITQNQPNIHITGWLSTRR